jgi:integrase-like protein
LRGPLEFGQYTSFDFTQALVDHNVLGSLGSTGDAYDNAMAESFVDSFKTELIRDRVWKTRTQLELAVVEWVGWYNHDRLHSALDHVPPAEYEALYARQDDASPSLMMSRDSNRKCPSTRESSKRATGPSRATGVEPSIRSIDDATAESRSKGGREFGASENWAGRQRSIRQRPEAPPLRQ